MSADLCCQLVLWNYCDCCAQPAWLRPWCCYGQPLVSKTLACHLLRFSFSSCWVAVRIVSEGARIDSFQLADADTHVIGVRFGLNWLKIRLWELREYDAVLYVDADVEVRTWTLPSVFELPTDFATVLDLNKAGYW